MEQFGKVSRSPTNPQIKNEKKVFDISELFSGPMTISNSEGGAVSLDEKMRKAYFWITNYAIITPFYDIEYNDGPVKQYSVGDTNKTTITFPSNQSYSSFILLPLLNLVVRRRCLFIGGPGRGKTASAILMGLLAGYSNKEVKRAIQHGQPQMTISDLLGNPIPSDMMKADNMDDIRISWRKWLGMRVKIIDEYNRIPTRTQSALLTVMGDNYAEILDQIYECPEAAWYLTANDDAGGGTYQVIEALKDRIDIVVRALHFNTRFIDELSDRIDKKIKPENMIPKDVIFSEEEIDKIYDDILRIEIPTALLRRIEFFAGQFEFFEPAGAQIEYMTKDNAKLSGIDFNLLSNLDVGKSKSQDIGLQTKNGLSVRALMTALIFIKSLAYFRGETAVSLEDIRNMLPFVLHDKLTQNSDSPFFEIEQNAIYRVDKVNWIRKLFDLSCSEYDRASMDMQDPVKELSDFFKKGLEGMSKNAVEEQLLKIEKQMEQYVKNKKFHGYMFDDILNLKYLHQRYSNYLRWLKWKK